ncbi:hypothetical protein TNIN_207631 [Trichonephila inaurata madagascariensis]|uniref:Uncharacterized protein n=1 Tax=Trichonephila inaurata madagascariensis TaxID=2747483 RepID=A0A8X7BZD5_9ARAC|nr:hypothetical protein TNIN_207631 [Trichonephila inaurata madagascariensis]
MSRNCFLKRKLGFNIIFFHGDDIRFPFLLVIVPSLFAMVERNRFGKVFVVNIFFSPFHRLVTATVTSSIPHTFPPKDCIGWRSVLQGKYIRLPPAIVSPKVLEEKQLSEEGQDSPASKDNLLQPLAFIL